MGARVILFRHQNVSFETEFAGIQRKRREFDIEYTLCFDWVATQQTSSGYSQLTMQRNRRQAKDRNRARAIARVDRDADQTRLVRYVAGGSLLLVSLLTLLLTQGSGAPV